MDGFPNVVKAIQVAADLGQPSGFITVIDDSDRVVGVITDSDIRKCLINNAYLDLNAEQIMTKNFLYFEEGKPLEDVVIRIQQLYPTRKILHRFPVSNIPVLDSRGQLRNVLNAEEVHQLLSKALSETVVIGLGFVGLTLAAALAKANYKVLGVDVNKTSVEAICNLKPHNNEPSLAEILKNHLGKNLEVSLIERTLPKRNNDMSSRNYLIAVGTSLKQENKRPELGPLFSALDVIASDIRRGDLVVVRSTVGVGSTRQIVIPRIEEKSGLKAGQDFYVVSAPERTIEGKAIEEIESLPQLLAGYTEECLSVATKFFTGISPRVVVLENLEACEFAKLISNTYRDVLFNFANEVALLAEEFRIDINRVIEDANSGYFRNNIPQPSPGVGGPCLVKDGYILREESSFGPSLIRTAREFNDHFIRHQFKRIKSNITTSDIIIVLGLAFKGSPPTNDFRDSFGVKIYKYLQNSGYNVYGWDATTNLETSSCQEFRSWQTDQSISADAIILICNNHPGNYQEFSVLNLKLKERLRLVYDPWRLIPEVDLSKSSYKYFTLSTGVQYES
jgi:UDP-N-acetyl-D-mannosaminuronic acid dehydrogenase